MKSKYSNIATLQVDFDKVWADYGLNDDDFQSASSEEKESMVVLRKSVSYWKDAARRFKKNRVSMVALVIFVLILLFAFLGPALIPYDYESQYRVSKNLEPRAYSSEEEKIRGIADSVDGFYATSLQPGSVTTLDKGNYYIEHEGNFYYFTLEKKIKNSVIVLDSNSGEKLYYAATTSIFKDKINGKNVIKYSGEEIQGAKKLNLKTKVFPHYFGTDSSGRDLMARTMYGARVSIIIGIAAAIIVLFIGSVYGAISGLSGGAVDFVMMRIVELIYSIPEVLIVLLLQVVLKDPLQKWFEQSESSFVNVLSDLGAGIVSIFITFAILYWVTMARIVRGQVLQLKKQEYVTAAVALGASNRRIIKRHLLPNCVGQLVITTCLQIPSAIFLESFLSFLGLGVSAPMASLGSLCSDALGTITLYPSRLVYPGMILTIIVLTLNLVGDGLRDALDPRLKK